MAYNILLTQMQNLHSIYYARQVNVYHQVITGVVSNFRKPMFKSYRKLSVKMYGVEQIYFDNRFEVENRIYYVKCIVGYSSLNGLKICYFIQIGNIIFSTDL